MPCAGRAAGSAGRLPDRLTDSLFGAGKDIGITGAPRGPCYDFKEGALVVARRARAPLLLFGAEFSAAWRLHSWDGFYIPKPFSGVLLRCVRVNESPGGDAAAAAEIALSLVSINPDRRQ